MQGNPIQCDCPLKYALAEERTRNIFYDIDKVICMNSTKTTKEYLSEIDCSKCYRGFPIRRKTVNRKQQKNQM